jgi:hypothetical protein
MTWVAVAVAGAAVVGAVVSSKSASKAASTQAGAARDATQAQLAMYEQTREDQAPWVKTGTWALNQLVGTQGTGGTAGEGYWTQPEYSQGITGYKTEVNEGMQNRLNEGFGVAGDTASRQVPVYGQTMTKPAQWVAGTNAPGTPGAAGTTGTTGLLQKGPGEFIPEQEPGYKFGYQEFVENPTLKLSSATGKLGSGATLKALTRYASNYASTKYDNFLDRYYKSLDPYYRLAGLGSNVAVSGGNQATNTAQGIAGTTLASGQATAAGQLGSAYPWSKLATNLSEYAAAYKPKTQSGGSSLGYYSTTPRNLPDYTQ